jgi:hypothetical protein
MGSSFTGYRGHGFWARESPPQEDGAQPSIGTVVVW